MTATRAPRASHTLPEGWEIKGWGKLMSAGSEEKGCSGEEGLGWG